MKNVTIKDIANSLNVSEATVSLAINNNPNVSKKTRERVINQAELMGYTPNSIARSLATNRTMTLGCVCPNPENPSYARLIKRISSYSEDFGYSVMLGVSEDSSEREQRIIKQFLGAKVDGIIIVPTDKITMESNYLDVLRNSGVPYVFAMSYYEGIESDIVIPDYKYGSYIATKELLNNGCNNIWYFVASDINIPVAKLRLDGWKLAFAESGLEWKEDWIIRCNHMDSKFSYLIAKKLLQKTSFPDAICTQNDYLAMGVRKAIIECGFRIPDDISLVGYDDVLENLYMDNPLTTVRLYIDKIAEEALRLLIFRIENPKDREKYQTKIITTELVKRCTAL